MEAGRTGLGAGVVGRETELAVLKEFVAGSSLGAIVLTAGPGMGKTTLWEAGVACAGEGKLRVLTARPSDAEARLSFAALTDLFDAIDTSSLSEVPPPQLHALQVALLREEPAGAPPEPHAIGTGFLNALRELAVERPLLIAIDDVQWLDPPSAEVLAFAARRLEGEAVRFLVTRRTRGSTSFERALEERGAEGLEIGPISLGATRRILFDRLGLSLSRRAVRRIFEASLGNPLFALELGRSLAKRGSLEIGEEIPVPDLVDDLLGARVEELPESERRLLLAVALTTAISISQLTSIVEDSVIDAAFAGGLLEADGDRARVSHPLLAAAARARSRPEERRTLHLALAGVVAPDLRVRHLVLAAREPDEGLASTVGAAARRAAARGVPEEAVELAEHALRLTPSGSPARAERLLALADHLLVAGESQRATDLLTPELEGLPNGRARARAHLLLHDGGGIGTLDDAMKQLELALAEGGDDASLRATVLARKAECTALVSVTQMEEAETWAEEALSDSRGAEPEVQRLALYGLGWVRALRGRPIEDLCERFSAVSDAAFHLADSLARVTAVREMWRGETKEARTRLNRLISLADQRGETVSYAVLRLHICELEGRVGEWDAVTQLLDEWDHSPDRAVLVGPSYKRCRALVAAGRGLAEEAELWAKSAIADAEITGIRWDLLESLRAQGITALLGGDPVRAVECLREVWEHTSREGVRDPGAFPVAPDLVEGLVELGDHEGAREVTARLNEFAGEQEHPWAQITELRCDAIVRLAASVHDDEAATALERAAAAYGDLGLRFDASRSLLALGRAQRRHKKWGAARDALARAAASFDDLGSPGWAERARAELARVGGRKPRAAGELTPAERHTAELAAQGLSNKEIARRQFVTVRTVEEHLSRAYAKLGVRSRAQLARRLPTHA